MALFLWEGSVQNAKDLLEWQRISYPRYQKLVAGVHLGFPIKKNIEGCG
jgi:hypothetical protein